MLDPARIGTVAWISFRAALRGWWIVALSVLAGLPSIVVLLLLATGTPADVADVAAQSLFFSLVVRVVVILVVLVLSVAQFRTEIEEDTLTYLTSRSIRRLEIVLGKYAGSLGAALALLLPAGLLPLAIAGAAGASAPPMIVPVVIAIVTILACLSYGAIFLLLGLVSRSALLLGLLYGFLWEELALLLPGDFPKLTLLYYLESYGSDEIAQGPLSGFVTQVSAGAAIVALVGVAALATVLTIALFDWVETAPQRITA